MIVRGNIEWTDDKRNEVVFIPNVNGRFYINEINENKK